jgi:hypothetical protein
MTSCRRIVAPHHVHFWELSMFAFFFRNGPYDQRPRVIVVGVVVVSLVRRAHRLRGQRGSGDFVQQQQQCPKTKMSENQNVWKPQCPKTKMSKIKFSQTITSQTKMYASKLFATPKSQLPKCMHLNCLLHRSPKSQNVLNQFWTFLGGTSWPSTDFIKQHFLNPCICDD